MNSIWRIAQQFSHSGQVADVRDYGNGNINDTYLVTVQNETESFILQRINTHVFTNPRLIIQNMRVYSSHVDRSLDAQNHNRRWDVPHIRATRDGQDFYLDEQENFWRALSFIKSARSYETAQNCAHAWEVGYALGRFHSLVSDLDISMMSDTLEGFHITPAYIRKYDESHAHHLAADDSPEARYCHRMIAERRGWASILEDEKAAGRLPMRVIHGDPKINNIMIGNETGQAVSIIDLDTVKPGLVHYDIGDCLRSSCNPLGEDTTHFDKVHFETDLARSILEGYLSMADDFLTDNEYARLYDSIRLLTFELGVRFFQDYLASNVYFKVRHPAHNLERAVVQFKLTESVERQEAIIRTIINDCRVHP